MYFFSILGLSQKTPKAFQLVNNFGVGLSCIDAFLSLIVLPSTTYNRHAQEQRLKMFLGVSDLRFPSNFKEVAEF